MFREEAIWIETALSKLKPSLNNTVANLGSSTAMFRQKIQPHIHQYLIDPLQKNGWKVLNVDMKQEDGVDVVGDLTNPAFGKQYKDQFALTICTNMLEHVENIPLVVKNLVEVTQSEGHILITVPYKYKIHHDPIDNGFRPTPQQIVDLFKDVAGNIVASHIIAVTDKDQYKIRKSRFPIWGYRERIAFYFGKRHKTSGILFSIKK
jgi:SAM-dependent methyltransferase